MAKTSSGKMTIIVFSGEMDKVMAAFILAVTAASMGKEVVMFFTFWGLNVVKKGDIIWDKGLMRLMLSVMNRGGVSRLPLSKLDMFGVGRWMMKKLMKDSKVSSIEEMIANAKKLGVKFYACTTTMGVMGLEKHNFIPEVDGFVGAAKYLEHASEAEVNLFV